MQNTKSAVLFLEPNQTAGVQLTLVPPEAAGTPEDRARHVAEDASVELLDGRRTRINGQQAFLGRYRIQNPENGQLLTALAAFIDYGDLLYELVGVAPEESFSQYSQSMERLVTSFQELRDSRILKVRPDHVSIYQVRRGGTLGDISRLFPHPGQGPEELARLNRLAADERLPAGTRVKVIVAGRK